MMKDERNYHQRLQEFCDCYLETDPKPELEKAARGISGDPSGELDELALKFLSLGIFYGASEKARNISLRRFKDGKVFFSIESKRSHPLLAPDPPLADRVIAIARAITHIDQDRGKETVSMGLRNDRIEIIFEFDRRPGEETFTVFFPELGSV